MARRAADVPQTNASADLFGADQGDGSSPPKLRALASNPRGDFGPRFWRAFCDSVGHLFDTLSLPHPAGETHFTLATRTYATPRGTLMRGQGTAFAVARGPTLAVRGPDQLLIVLQIEGSAEGEYDGRHTRR